MRLRIIVVLSWLVVGGILTQAVLAGQAWFVTPELFGLHGGIGHGVLGLSLALVVLTFLHGVGLWFGASVVLIGGLVAQTGLGYTGHRGMVALASSVHVPLGVALLGIATALAVLTTTAYAAERQVARVEGV